LKNAGKNAILDHRKRLDETPVAGNALEIAGWMVRGSSCGKGRTFESSRARQLLCAEGVRGAPSKIWRIGKVFSVIVKYHEAKLAGLPSGFGNAEGGVCNGNSKPRANPHTNAKYPKNGY
jgi:hypothetical protein